MQKLPHALSNSSISSSGGTATIAVDVPVVNRSLEDNTVVSFPLNDTITIAVHNGTGWFDYTNQSYIQGGQVIIQNIDTGSIKETSIEFGGRKFGDISGSGIEDPLKKPDFIDAIYALRYDAGGQTRQALNLSANSVWYGDVNNDGELDFIDAITLLRYDAGKMTDNYQPK